MFDFLKSKKDKKVPEAVLPEQKPERKPAQETPEKKQLFRSLSQGLQRTRSQLTGGLSRLFLGKKIIDEDLLEEIETCLLTADVGMEVTEKIITDITEQVSRKTLANADDLLTYLKHYMTELLDGVSQPLLLTEDIKPYVILMVGVNGAGKTTTIGKLTKQFQVQGKKVMLAAGDTFRAAAVEQLQIWGERNQVQVVSQKIGSDSASVVYDAFSAAKARGVDVLIADTAGRLHTQDNLMSELVKIKRVISKLDENAPHETMLVVDAGIGQNSLQQAKQFNEAVNLTGITLTKLDGTAKGGIIFSIAQQMGLPIRYVGVGEGIEDLQSFDAKAFVEALFEIE